MSARAFTHFRSIFAVMESDPVLRVFCEKRGEFLFGGRQRPVAKRGIDDLPFAAQFDILRSIIPAFASQFVDFQRLCEGSWTDSIDAAKDKPGLCALPDGRTRIDVP